MKRRFLMPVVLVVTFLATLLLTVNSGQAQIRPGTKFETAEQVPPPTLPNIPIAPSRPLPLNPSIPKPGISTACAVQPERQKPSVTPRSTLRFDPSEVTLARFRQSAAQNGKAIANSFSSGNSYTPVEKVVLIDPSNFGDRYLRDINGKPAFLDPIVVLHETVGSANSALNLFLTYHPNDDDQASYHALITRDGTIIYLVPPDKRAFGAGNSVFVGDRGVEAVQTHPTFPASVNNFAYHISLETPYDGNHNGYNHSGYSEAQYQSLAWLVAKTGVPDNRITTHKAVDRSRSRIDPRTFDGSKFSKLLNSYPRISEIAIRCTDPTAPPVTQPKPPA
jgi:hypothetical protein